MTREPNDKVVLKGALVGSAMLHEDQQHLPKEQRKASLVRLRLTEADCEAVKEAEKGAYLVWKRRNPEAGEIAKEMILRAVKTVTEDQVSEHPERWTAFKPGDSYLDCWTSKGSALQCVGLDAMPDEATRSKVRVGSLVNAKIGMRAWLNNEGGLVMSASPIGVQWEKQLALADYSPGAKVKLSWATDYTADGGGADDSDAPF